ncbi:MAG TPA: hypothetical protein VFY90_04625 [Tepidiformaceae bacterium]|nr:hypothetical protein [Tepidiformaceae bacterium]
MAAAALIAGAMVAVGAACGAGTQDIAPELEPAPSTPSMEIDVSLGPAIRSEAAAHFLPLMDEGWQAQPVAAYKDRFLVGETKVDREADSATQRFVIWDPATGARQPAWYGETGRQDIVAGMAGDTAVYVRTGLSLPFAEWSLEARNLVTGETQTIAQSRPEVASDPNVQPEPPFGLAPHPVVSGGKIAWAEYVWRNGGTNREVRMHDLATGWTVTLGAIPTGRGEQLDSVALGGNRAAWVHWGADGTARMVVHDLTSGAETPLDLDAKPFALALDDRGQTLAWDDSRGGKYSVRIDGSTPQRFAGDEGWGVVASGSRFSWAPAAAYGGTGGFFDLATGELRLVTRKPHVQVNYAAVLGGTFTWQELTTGADGAANEAKSGYYFMPLGT